MRIIANLGVKDEIELIEGAIEHLRAIGVDLIIAWEMNLRDGTYEILERYRSDGDFWLLRCPGFLGYSATRSLPPYSGAHH